MLVSPVPDLSPKQVAAVAPLVAIGGQSGDTVVGLSAVRRTRGLAFVFVDASISDNTLSELGRRRREGTRVLRVPSMPELAARLGRTDVSVLGVKAGPLAAGVARKLQPGTNGELTAPT